MTTSEGQVDGDPRRIAAASEWVVIFDALAEEPLSRDEWQAWDDFAADAENLAAYNRLAVMREHAAMATPPPWPTSAELLADRSDETGGSPPPPVRLGPKSVALKSPLLIALLAATITALAFALMSLLHGPAYHFRSPPGRAVAMWSTGIGEHRRQVLPDGSVITLGARSSVSIKFSALERDVMLTSGEALFQVAHNKARPFKVTAGNGSVTALGTEFNVLRQARRVVVTVTEGTVLVAPLSPPIRDLPKKDAQFIDAPPWIPARISRGQEMSYDAEGQASAVARTDSRIVTAWNQGTLVYRRRPLSEVIEDVKRYSPREISLGEGVGQLLYTGTVSELNVDDWIHALPKIYSVEVIDDSSSPVRIRIQLRAEPARSSQETDNH